MNKRRWLLAIACSFFLALFMLAAVWLPGQYRVPVLTYHSVAPFSSEPLNNVTPEVFAAQMRYLKDHGYKVLSLGEFVDGLKSGRTFDRKSVVITFDDGYENNFTVAYPVLRAEGLFATFFVEVAHLGLPGRLTWDQVKEMDANGVAIESHTLTGAYLPALTREEVRHEIVEARQLLQKHLGRPVNFLAYPIGGFSEEIKILAREAGYAAAFTTNRGYDRRAKDLYELKRIRIKDSDQDLQMWLKLSGYYNLIRNSKEPS